MVPSAAIPDARHKLLEMGGNALIQNRSNSLPCAVQLGLSDKGRAIKGLADLRAFCHI